MRSSMDAVAGMRLLLAGDDASTIGDLRAAVALTGAVPSACRADPGEVAALVAHDPPAAVIAVAADAAALRYRLDPLSLDNGPEVVELEELTGPGGRFDAVAARRLRALVDRRELRRRAAELESVAADMAVARRRDADDVWRWPCCGGWRWPPSTATTTRTSTPSASATSPHGSPATSATTTAPCGSCARRLRCTTSARSPSPTPSCSSRGG